MSVFLFFALLSWPLQASEIRFPEEHSVKVRTSFLNPCTLKADEISNLAKIINEAYLKGEEGICLPDMQRISYVELNNLINNNNIIGLKCGNSWKGCIQIGASPYDDKKLSGHLGMLAIADEESLRGRGYGTLLVNHAEEWARGQGYKHMTLELIKPADWIHPHKERLEKWYKARGYAPIGTKLFPHPEVLKITRYVFTFFRKVL